ncbi:hypothetical protein IAD21_01600 [Abditibacteriota bacterium]|nr:hypothetical protein IAD21_01600 [Abditibacteriota bacterium]
MRHLFFVAALLGMSASAFGTPSHPLSATVTLAGAARTLPPLPPQLPAWLDSKQNNDIFYKRGAFNFAITNIPALNRDMNGVAVGHALAYEALVTGREKSLETTVWDQINHVLKNPPKFMPTEKSLSPTFGQKYGVLEQVFDWTHVSHAQTIDVLASPRFDNADKDAETTRVWDYYRDEGAPFTVTGLPMNMAWLDSQAYSGAFRRKYPKVNALFWGYHWLQTSIYDGLRDKTPEEQKKMYALLGRQYHDVELYDTKRPFMPMMAETSPLFSAKYPDIANAFDNLHMLHDMVNDILASDWMTGAQKTEQIKRAVYMMSPDAHNGCKPGENRGVIDGISHDHRFMAGMPGMGIMKTGIASEDKMPMSGHAGMNMAGMTMPATPAKGEEFDPTRLMWMPKMGWMDMSQCHHCSMPLTGGGDDPLSAWQNSTISAEGWTMRVRCALCARDMSAETKGGAILSLATEDPNRRVIVFSDERGNLTTDFKGAVFLEEKGGHPKCSQWSQAFTSRAAFDAYVAKNPKFKEAKPLSFEEWANVEAAGTPDTYEKEEGPVENPYAADLKTRGIAPDEGDGP